MKMFYTKKLCVSATAVCVLAFGTSVLAQTADTTAAATATDSVLQSSSVVILPTTPDLADCNPDIQSLIVNNPVRNTAFAVLQPFQSEFEVEIDAITTDPFSLNNYLDLLNTTAQATSCTLNALSNNQYSFSGCTYRGIVTLPEGRVLVDTNTINSLAKANNDTIGTNKNTHSAFMDVQMNSCGYSAETMFDPSTGNDQDYLVMRIGDWRHNSGTTSLSVLAAPC